MKALFLALAAFAVTANAYETTVQCKRKSGPDCAVRTVVAFQMLGCRPDPASIRCRDAATDPYLDPSYKNDVIGYDFCDITSACHEPNYGNFGGISCNYGRSGEVEVDLRGADSNLTLTTSTGIWQRYVTTLCK